MAMHFIPVGIEADSKEEAEQKILKIQEVATEYVVGSNDKPAPKKLQATVSDSIWTFAALIGISLLEGYAENKAHEEDLNGLRKSTVGRVNAENGLTERRQIRISLIMSRKGSEFLMQQGLALLLIIN